jgi:two-component system cell cycle sensor histidine kinase/response regulator CckA
MSLFPPDKPQYDPQVLLNSQPVMSTVIDPESYKVLFQNHASISTFGDMSNLTCYENIAGCASPLFVLQDARNR